MDRHTMPGVDFARRTAIFCVAASTIVGADTAKADKLNQLAAQYYECSGQALGRVLSAHAATTCAEVYLRLKLRVHGGPSFTEFQRLPIEERAQVNAAAYRSFQNWATQMSMAKDASSSPDQLE